MCWSQPKPWAKTIGRPVPSPPRVTLLRRRTSTGAAPEVGVVATTSAGERDDDDRARRVVHDLLADRAQQQPAEAAASARADDEQVGLPRRLEERLGRAAPSDAALDLHPGGVDAGERELERLVRTFLEQR